MFTKTKHNLSYGEVTLDYEALKKIVEAGLYSTTCKIEEQLLKIQRMVTGSEKSNLFSLEAGRVADLMFWLQSEAETVEALRGIETREEVKWVNLPKRKEMEDED